MKKNGRRGDIHLRKIKPSFGSKGVLQFQAGFIIRIGCQIVQRCEDSGILR
jgi:hypothetical protein